MVKENKIKEDTHSYNGWLNSDSFFKRALAIGGYGFIGTMIIYVPLIMLIVLFGVLFGTVE